MGELAAYAGTCEVGVGECSGGVSLGVVEVCELRCGREAEGVVRVGAAQKTGRRESVVSGEVVGIVGL